MGADACEYYQLSFIMANLYVKKAGHISDNELKSQKHLESVKNAPKPVRAPWPQVRGRRRVGEAGDFVEVCSRGGIIRYNALVGDGEHSFFLLARNQD